ncbi:MAG: DHH family phosphoesterase [Clostridia bacterium]|nr:DHH family phosphoesterase [Clostridia bacterium]
MKILALFYQNPAGYLAALLLLVFSAVSFAINNNTAWIFLVAFAFVLVANVLYSVLSFKATRKYIKEVNKSLSQEKISNVDSFPLPCVMCDMKGNIVWFNKEFGESVLTDKQKVSIYDFFKDYNFYSYSELKTADSEFNGKMYTAFITRIKSKTSPMLCFYFFDDTYMKETEQEYKLSRPFVMSIFVDNIDQLLRQLTDSKFAQISSGIESKIEDWLKDENLILKKTGNGNFFVIGEKRNLDRLSAEKFSVLKDVREYKHNNTPVNATLSIGVGTGADLSECEARAKKALEMSLGRGGDQVAVYTENGYVYYGGMSNLSNDNSRVSPRQTAANISTLVKKYKKAIVVGHKFSDYDAIGSAMGIKFFAEANGVQAYVAIDEKTTLAESLVDISVKNGFDGFISLAEALEMCDNDTILFVVDTHRKFLLDEPELYEKAKAKVVIDHHRRSDDFINDADIFYHHPSPSSTCEMVAELIEYSTIQKSMSPVISTALLSGIVLDTKEFVLRTSRRTFEAAAFLKENKADTVAVKKLFSVSTEMINLKNEILSNAVVYNGCMISATERNSPDLRIVTAKAADEMLNIENVKASFVLSYITKDIIQISARSLGEENVQLIMENLGGGGHSTMAATQIKNTDIENAKSMLLKAIDAYNLAK